VDININSYIPMTNVEGPNTRFCIWVQGCSIRCKGCANSHMWNKADGTIYDVEDMVELIASYKDKIEGITFLGGEPLEQIEAVTYISKKVQELGLTVLVFTGYDYQEISSRQDIKELIKHIDMLIDGKYDETQRDFSRAWVGSSNQNYYFFSDKYDESVITKFKNKIELRIDKNNKISFNGMGNFEELMKAI
jgi:anaerobic ribonucleoside-triphosphate reductase activating protein